MHKYDSISINLPSKIGYVSVAVAAVKEYAVRLDFSKSEAVRLSQAAEEAVLHALRFGYGGDDETLHIEMSTAATGLRLTIRSKGLPLSEDLLPQYDPERLPAEGDLTGLDAFLIRRLMDSVQFSVNPEGLREIVMIKHFPAPLSEHDEELRSQAADVLDADDIDPIIRLARPEDAESISRLALRAHGSLLFSEDLYYPEHVREMIDSGAMISMVAVTECGAVVSHGALVINAPGDMVEELTYGFTAPEYRSKGSVGEIARKLLENAVSRGVQAVFASAVTTHDKSQRAAAHLGFTDCALFLASTPASRARQTKEGLAPGRISDLAMVRCLHKTDMGHIYAPLRHRRMMKNILLNLGVRVRFLQLADHPLQKEARIKTFSDVKAGWAVLFIAEYGRDTVEKVDSLFRLLCDQGVFSVQLVLPLRSPAVGAFSEAFEAKGFFFSGVMPDWEGHATLVLQRQNGVIPDYDSIIIYSPAGRELLNYVRSCDPSN